MAQKMYFIRWLVIACITLAGLFMLWEIGMVARIWNQDASCLSGVILVFFFFVSGYLGLATYRSPRGLGFSCEEIGWFSSELCMGLGMVGTIVGLIMMLSGFEGLDATNVKSVQQLLTELGGSLGTALYTTLTGLACGINMKIQTFNLSLANKTDGSLEEFDGIEEMPIID